MELHKGNLEFYELSDFLEQEKFLLAYSQRSGTHFPPAELEKSVVWGLFDEKVLVGGFILKRGPNYRAGRAIASHFVQELLFRKPSPIEVTGLWLDGAYKSSSLRLKILRFMSRAIRDMGSQSLIGITTKRPLWEKTYRRLGAKILYEGPTELVAGTVKNGVVFEISLNRLSARMPFYLAHKLALNFFKVFVMPAPNPLIISKEKTA